MWLWAVAASLFGAIGCSSTAPELGRERSSKTSREHDAQSSVASNGALARVRASGVLRWGGDRQGGEPFVFEAPENPGTLIGFEVEIANALAHAIGVEAEFVQSDWSTLIPALERGTFDVALNGIEVIAALEGRVLFTRPYFVFSERLVARAGDEAIRDLASLRGRKVGTLAASQAWFTAEEMGAKTVPYEGVDEPFLDLAAGRTDAVLLDDIIVARYASRHPGLRVIGDVGAGTYAIAVRPEDGDLRDGLDVALGRMIAAGELRAILARWGLDSARQDALAQHGRAASPAELATHAHAPGGTAEQVPQSGGREAATSRAQGLGRHHILLFLKGAGVTLFISVAAMLLAVPLGLALALARLYTRRLRYATAFAVELLRGTPVLLQLYVLYFGLAPVLRLDALGAAVLGLGLNYAAYESEIHRAGILAVPRGQMEAALSLGMTRPMALRRIVLPQAFRVSLPGIANDFIALLKDSSLVSVITVVELTKRMTITAVDTRSWLLPGLICGALYFAMSYPLARLARRLERRLGARAVH